MREGEALHHRREVLALAARGRELRRAWHTHRRGQLLRLGPLLLEAELLLHAKLKAAACDHLGKRLIGALELLGAAMSQVAELVMDHPLALELSRAGWIQRLVGRIVLELLIDRRLPRG